MKKQFLTPIVTGLLLTCLLFYNKASAQNQNFSIGLYDTLHSFILNEDRRLLIHIPEGAHDNSVHYPVMYLLDGESHFTKTIGIIDHLSNTTGNELCPQMIVVAIFHPNRDNDLIPPASNTDITVKDKFPEFLEKELIPFIDSHYPTTSYRVCAGHSLGGLRVVNTLIYQPQLFNCYLALDPSLGHVKKWIDYASDTFNKNNYTGKSLYIAMGQTMPKGMDTLAILKDTTGASRHMRCIINFAKNAERNISNGMDFNWKYYPDETHQSVVFKGTYEGLIANFHWFKNEKLFDIFNPDVNATSSVKVMTDYYERISQKFGYKIIPPEEEISGLIDYLTFKGWHDKGFAFAQLNLNNYPSSERTKKQFESTKWYTKKSLSDLMPSKTVKEIYDICKKEATKINAEYNISEDALNSLGYDLMQRSKLIDAEILFKLNVELYPNSYNVYDSYGECLLRNGKEKEGITAYRKSLELNPENTNASKILEKYQ